MVKDLYSTPCDLLPEALLAVRSKGLHFVSHEDEAFALLDHWRRREEIKQIQSSKKPSAMRTLPPFEEPSSIDEIIDLLRLHRKLQFFVNDYSTNAPQPQWVYDNSWEKDTLPITMSNDEKGRFLRALCRVYTITNLYTGAELDSTTGLIKNTQIMKSQPFMEDGWEGIDRNQRWDALTALHATLPPWELEEIACVCFYFDSRYEKLCQKIKSEDKLARRIFLSCRIRTMTSAEVEKFEWENGGTIDTVDMIDAETAKALSVPAVEYFFNGQFPWVDNADDLVECISLLNDSSMEFVSFGPDFLYRVLHADGLHRRQMLLRNVLFGVEEDHEFLGPQWYLGICDFRECDLGRPFIFPADRHYGRPYYEQYWSTLPSLERPSLGWKKLYLSPNRGLTWTLENPVIFGD